MFMPARNIWFEDYCRMAVATRMTPRAAAICARCYWQYFSRVDRAMGPATFPYDAA